MIYAPRRPQKLLPYTCCIADKQCLSVELYEHQLQDAQWMLDQETLDGGSMQHLWAELPPHPLAPAVCASRRYKHSRKKPKLDRPADDYMGDAHLVAGGKTYYAVLC